MRVRFLLATFIFSTLLSTTAPAKDAPQALGEVGWDAFIGQTADGRLDVDLSTRVEPSLRGQRTAVWYIGDRVRPWIITTAGRRYDEQRRPTRHLQAVRLAFAGGPKLDDLPLQLVSVAMTPQQIELIGRGQSRGQRTVSTVTFVDDPRAGARVSLRVETAGDPQPVQLVVPGDVAEFATLHGELTRRYILPLVRPLHGGTNPIAPMSGDLVRLFPDIPPLPADADRLQKLIARLSDPDPAERERATEALSRSTGDVARAVAFVDRASLLPEATVRLDEFLASQCRYPQSWAQRRSRDPATLIDSLEATADPRIRRAAIDRLERVTNRTFDVPPVIDDALAPAVARTLRRELDLD